MCDIIVCDDYDCDVVVVVVGIGQIRIQMTDKCYCTSIELIAK